MVFVVYHEQKYGLNGAALGVGMQRGWYRDGDDLMLRDSNGYFTFQGPHDLIRRGLEMCNYEGGPYK